jgi:hypothetical protein
LYVARLETTLVSIKKEKKGTRFKDIELTRIDFQERPSSLQQDMCIKDLVNTNVIDGENVFNYDSPA